MMELGVVTILTTVLILGMVRWLTGIGATARVGFQDAADGRRAMVTEQLRRDIEGAVHCDAGGRDARVRELAADRLTLVVQSDADAELEIVGWRVNNGALERGETELDADCEGTPGDWGVWATDVADITFTKIIDGAASEAGTAGSCGDELLVRCQVETIGVDLSFDADPAVERIALTLP